MALTRATDKIIANADGNLNLSGIVTAANFVGGGAGLTGLNVDASALKSGSDIKAQANPHGVVVTGVLTATSYSGDGSNLTNLPAGLGTALSSDQTSPLNKLYYTNEVLSIASTITVDHPATGTGAYTQYADLRLEEDADLIIADGDDVIPNILGLGTDGGGLGAGGSGRVRVDSITNKNANGAPNFPNGVTGTAATFTNSSTIAGIVTLTSGGVDTVGVVTATSFKGAATNLTSIPAANITGTLPAISGANLTNLNGSNISSGIVTSARLGGGSASATTFLNGHGNFAEAGGGKILKYETTSYSTEVSHSGTSYTDSGLSATIQPSAAGSKILVMLSQFFNVNVANPNVGAAVQVLEGSNVIVPSQTWELYYYPGLSGNYSKNYNHRYNVTMIHTPSYSLGDTLTFKSQMKVLSDGNTTNIKAQKSSSTSYLTLMELAP